MQVHTESKFIKFFELYLGTNYKQSRFKAQNHSCYTCARRKYQECINIQINEGNTKQVRTINNHGNRASRTGNHDHIRKMRAENRTELV